MLGALVAGLLVGDLYTSREAGVLARASLHRLSGVGAALAVILVNGISVTYFVGASRWCKEVSDTYALEAGLLARSLRLKRSAFPWAVAGMLTVIVVSALGAASDPATGRIDAADYSIPHLAGALVGLAVVGYAFVMQAVRIRDHGAVIEEIVAEVRRIRQAKGLEV